MKLMMDVIWLVPLLLGGEPELVGSHAIGIFPTLADCEAHKERLQESAPPDWWYDHFSPEFAGPREYFLECVAEEAGA